MVGLTVQSCLRLETFWVMKVDDVKLMMKVDVGVDDKS